MSQLELNDRTLILHRFPQMRDESPLQAWMPLMNISCSKACRLVQR